MKLGHRTPRYELSEGKLYEGVDKRDTPVRLQILAATRFARVPGKASSQPKSKQGDMARFLSQDHLQSMFTRLMGTQQAGRDSQEVVDDKDYAKDDVHELWERGLHHIKSASDLSQVPKPAPGISHTITEAIREFSTALGNMWDGRIYKKALRYLCRIALRLQLAPTIDRSVKAWKRRATLRKQDQQQKREARTALTKKQWKKRIKDLFDDLGDLRRPLTTQHIGDIRKSIVDLEVPQSSQQRIRTIEERMNEQGLSSVADIESDAEGTWSVHQDMMTSDDDGAGKRSCNEEVDRLALQAARELRAAESAIKPLRQEVETRQARQDAACWRVKKQQSGAYAELVAARKSLREKRTGLLKEEQDLKRLRQDWYRLNKMSEAAGKMRRSSITGSLSPLRIPEGHVLAWSGTDYGISKMSETVALKLVNDRQRALKKPVKARVPEALKNIGTREASLKNAATVQHVDRAFSIQELNRPVLREFEHSHSLQKQRHNQELRSKRAWDVVAAEERRYVKQVGRDQGSGSLAPSSADLAPDGWCEECQCHHVPVVEHNMFRARRFCPPYDAKVLPIMIIGDKGTGVGSRIGGHARRGGTNMHKNHKRFCTVAIHDEFRFAPSATVRFLWPDQGDYRMETSSSGT
ncbi:hypothetical protein KVV02_008847 [Mortierella alpina]|uniref:Uncharacterized protein n=1 Tax=Mortierella alpina TaxID=64518 RepID=A0A9P8A323_MORAP|nr:hypothetical protein KVV02_008847 [Mortierella alpina]